MRFSKAVVAAPYGNRCALRIEIARTCDIPRIPSVAGIRSNDRFDVVNDEWCMGVTNSAAIAAVCQMYWFEIVGMNGNRAPRCAISRAMNPSCPQTHRARRECVSPQIAVITSTQITSLQLIRSWSIDLAPARPHEATIEAMMEWYLPTTIAQTVSLVIGFLSCSPQKLLPVP